MRVYSIAESLIAWLGDNGHAAYHIAPPAEDAPTEFVTVERTGGYVADKVDHPSVAIQCWAATDTDAERLAITIRNLVELGARPEGVGHMAINSGPYAFYDEETRMPRYQLYVDIACQLTD